MTLHQTPTAKMLENERSASRAARRARLEARVSPEQKSLLERAAALEGRTLTDFVVASAQQVALETIERHEVLALTARDSLAFAQALIQPRKPNVRLRRAARRHRSLITD
jgi:uncharacterized protein (DUF1778 family)